MSTALIPNRFPASLAEVYKIQVSDLAAEQDSRQFQSRTESIANDTSPSAEQPI